ncbi:hypothetical protein GGI20_000157 [Coemansia sp. BCRC 34301]|nr:hypothetical protein GGI20_000157 [Coemansia sp. BCRC 34301]
MPTSVAHQTFWDRIPNATSKIALLGKSERTRCHSASTRQSNASPATTRRASKRKQLRPMRSPLAPLPATASTSASASTAQEKSRCLSADTSPHLPWSAQSRPNKEEGGMSRAFRLSFSDAYSRNPHEYVQALIYSESTVGTTPGTPLQGKPHMHRSRRGYNSSGYSSSARFRNASSRHHGGGSSSSAPKQRASNGAAARAGRFHHLQVEQTMSENDDANSVTTTASDCNELADADGRVPASPQRHRYQLPAQAIAASDSEACSTPAHLPAAAAAAAAAPATAALAPADMDVDAAEPNNEDDLSPSVPPSLTIAAYDSAGDMAAESEDDNDSQPESPLSESPLSDENESQSDDTQAVGASSADEARVLGSSNEDNMPSYRRMGLDFTDEHDVALITPAFARSNVKWNKADPINVADKPMADKLAPAESHCCSVLRILPEQYLAIKLTLLKEGRTRLPGSFKKRDAQRLCRIDVNKTSKIYEWFVTLGWLPESNGVYANPVASLH